MSFVKIDEYEFLDEEGLNQLLIGLRGKADALYASKRTAETIKGAQEKIDIALSKAKNYANNLVNFNIVSHNTDDYSHTDIRLLIKQLNTRLNALANSDDVNLDQMAELVEYIKSNRELIESVTTNKISTNDIINNLTTNDTTKPLSAAQGVVLKKLIDDLPSWAKEDDKPSYTAEEIGADKLGAASEAISIHNIDIEAHEDIRKLIDLLDSRVKNTNSNITNTISIHNTDMVAHEDIRKAISDHTSNSDIHVTTADKTNWNNKVDDTHVSNAFTVHNIDTTSHNDIRLLIDELNNRLTTLANSDDTTLDQMAEVVSYIKSNRSLIESITTDKVNVDDIINNLTTNISNKPLSAAQGVILKGLIDELSVNLGSTNISISNHNYDGNAHTDIRKAISDHTSNLDIHVTSQDKTNWNNKVDASYVDSKIQDVTTKINSNISAIPDDIIEKSLNENFYKI